MLRDCDSDDEIEDGVNVPPRDEVHVRTWLLVLIMLNVDVD